MRAAFGVIFTLLAIYFIDHQFFNGKYTAGITDAARSIVKRY